MRHRLLKWFMDRLVRWSLYLDGNPRYQRVKRFCRDLLENERAPQKRYFDLFMIVLVLASVAVLINDVAYVLPDWVEDFEYFAVSVFIIEYLARFWVSSDIHRVVLEEYERSRLLEVPMRNGVVIRRLLRDKWSYVRSPAAIIDLLAILPSYRSIRLLRIFLLFRLFKIFRYSRSASAMAQMLAEKRFEFYTLAIFMSFVLLGASSAVYVFEADTEDTAFHSFFDAIYWSFVTLSTVGYGDITPHTPEGRIVTMVLILSGIGVLSFATSIVVSAFQERLPELRQRRVLSELDRLHQYTVVCGYGRVGEVVADQLARSGTPLVIIEKDPERVQDAARRGHLAILGNAESDELLRDVGLEGPVRNVLCVMGDDVANVFVTISARQMNRRLRIIARANGKQAVDKLKLAGADYVVAPFEIVGLVASEYVGKPVAFDAIHGILSGGNDVQLETIPLPAGSPLFGEPIGRLALRQRKLLLFGIITGLQAELSPETGYFALADRHFYFNPPSFFTLREKDILVVVGHRDDLRDFQRTIKNGKPLPELEAAT